MTLVSEQRLSLAENLRIQKRAFSACFQAENSLFKNPSTGGFERGVIRVASVKSSINTSALPLHNHS